MKGKEKGSKQKGVANERRRQSLRTRKSVPNAKKTVEKTKKKSKKRTPLREPVRETSVETLSGSDGSDGSEGEEMQPMQPLEFYFKSSEFPKTCKIQTKCFVTKTVELIKDKPEAQWFTSHPQFRHFFHMPDEPNLKLQGMWMLLLRTICIPEDDMAWFAVNGVPIRYSMREHALISGLDCREYPPNYEKMGSYKFVDYYFHDRKKITITDVQQKMLSMPPCPDRLKMTVLFFLGRVIRGKPKDSGSLDLFILRMVDDLEACRSFPWGRLTFEDAIKGIKHMMNHLKGEVNDTCGFPGFIIPLEVLAFEAIPDLGKAFRIYSDDSSEDCPRMCKSRFTKCSLKGYPLEDIYDALGETKVINSVLVPTIGEEIMMARIIDEEREYDRHGSPSETWNYWLTVKQKTIWWKELYELDQASRVFPKKTVEKKKVTFAEGSSSNAGLDSSLRGLEERILEFIGEGFVGLNLTVETKLESIESRMSAISKNQRLLRRRAKKIEGRLTSIERKVEQNHGEDMDSRQWGHMGMDYDPYEARDKVNVEQEAGKEKENSGSENSVSEQKDGEQKKKNSESESDKEEDTLRQVKERSIAQAEAFWNKILGEESEEKEAETSEKEKENNKEDEKDEEKVVESETEGEDDREEVGGKEDEEVEEEEKKGEEEEKGEELDEEKEKDEEEKKDEEEEKGEKEEKDEEEVEQEVEAEINQPRVEAEINEPRVEETPTPPPSGNQTEETPTPPPSGNQTDQTPTPPPSGNQTDQTPTPPSGNQTPTPPRGRTKSMAARRRVITPPREMFKGMFKGMTVEEEPGKSEEAEKAVEREEKSSEKQVEEAVEEQLGKAVEEYTEEEKQRWIMVVYKEPASPWIMHRCTEKKSVGDAAPKKKTVGDAAPKKRGRPRKNVGDAAPKKSDGTPQAGRGKRKCEPSQWVQSPFTEGKTDDLDGPSKKRKTKA